MQVHTRLFRPSPPHEMEQGLAARLDVHTNVVTYNIQLVDLRNSRDLRFLKALDENETELFVDL